MMGTASIVGMILLMLILLFLAGWFAGSETAITNISASQMAKIIREKRKGSLHLIKVKKNMDRSLVTILVANNIVNIVLSSIAALFADALFNAIGVTLMVGLITFLIITFGEIVPKSAAIDDSMNVSLRHARGIYYLTILFTPIDILLVSISNLVMRLRGKKPRKKLLITDQTVMDMVRMGEEEGIFKSIERDIIDKVFVFGDRKVKDIMVPMKKVFYLDRDMSKKDARKIISSRGYTRVPYLDQKGNLRGLIYSKDLLSPGEENISDKTREALFISGDMDITEAFDIMKRRRIHMAVVTGEEDKPLGIVTLEDVLEEIVGEIYDEYFPVKYGRIKEGKRGSLSVKGTGVPS